MSGEVGVRITGHHPEPRAFCEVCKEWQPLDAILEHLRVDHAMNVEIEEWPDGSPVIVDTTLTPEDFARGEQT